MVRLGVGHKRTKPDNRVSLYCTLLHGGGCAVPKTSRRKQREPFGRIRKLPSGRYQAAYVGPDTALHKAAATFETLLDARGWLTDERRQIDAGTWTAPEHRNRRRQPETLGAFAAAWLTTAARRIMILADLPRAAASAVDPANAPGLRVSTISDPAAEGSV